MFIVKNRKLFYILSIILVVISVFAVAKNGLNKGLDFTGGTLIEVKYINQALEKEEIENRLDAMNLDGYSIRKTGEKGYIIKIGDIKLEEKDRILSVIENPSLIRFDSIGPVLGEEAFSKSIFSIIIVIIAIVLFITHAFRKVSKPISSWVYGLISIVALVHDVLIPTGVFSLIGYEVDTLFVTALLVVLGFSIHDTIVVFDRVRENLIKNRGNKKDFESIVGESIGETFVRSLNTSLTTVIALVVLYFFGPEATRHFSLALIVGIIAGTYSSIFIASPLLVTVQKFLEKRE